MLLQKGGNKMAGQVTEEFSIKGMRNLYSIDYPTHSQSFHRVSNSAQLRGRKKTAAGEPLGNGLVDACRLVRLLRHNAT